MTNDAPKRIWAGGNRTEYCVNGQRESITFHDGAWSAVSQPGWIEYIRADHAQAEVAAAYLDASDFAADTADQGEGPDGVLWADMAQVVDAIESRTPDDAKASLDRLLKAELQAAVAAEREAVARWAEGERQTCNNQGDRAGAVAYRRMCVRVRARGNSDALERVRQEAKAEALREAIDAVDSIDDKGESDIARALLDARRAILALIPDEHKEGAND